MSAYPASDEQVARALDGRFTGNEHSAFAAFDQAADYVGALSVVFHHMERSIRRQLPVRIRIGYAHDDGVPQWGERRRFTRQQAAAELSYWLAARRHFGRKEIHIERNGADYSISGAINPAWSNRHA